MIGGFAGGIPPRRPGGPPSSTLGVVQSVAARVAPTRIPLMPQTHTVHASVVKVKEKPPAKLPPVAPPVVTPFPVSPKKDDGFPYHVVILSKNPSNLSRCLDAVLANEPKIPAGRIIVVDDGARAGCKDVFAGVHWLTGTKPFVFARNANQGIQWAGTDVILLNDDALLVTKNGFEKLSRSARQAHDLGVVAAAVRGDCGNPHQQERRGSMMRNESQKLSFICVYIKLGTIEKVGLLDERYIDYGWEDDDYCLRVTRAGLKLGIYDLCVVDHGRPETSSFRTKPNIGQLITNNRLRYEAKWKGYVRPL